MATAPNEYTSSSLPGTAAPLLLLAAFASLWWLLPRLLSHACWRFASRVSGVGAPQSAEAGLLAELRSNRQERRALSNSEANFVSISRLDRRANRLRAQLAPLKEARIGQAALWRAGASLTARALSNFAAAVFLYRCRGVAVMKLPLLADWFAPFHWLLTIGADQNCQSDCLTSSSLILLCLGAVSLGSGLANISPTVGSGGDDGGGFGDIGGVGVGGIEGFVAEATAAVAAEAETEADDVADQCID